MHAEDSLMMQNYIEGDLDMVSRAHDMRNTYGTALGGALEKDLEDLKGIIGEYNIAQSKLSGQPDLKPRDFRADLPILTALRADNYD